VPLVAEIALAYVVLVALGVLWITGASRRGRADDEESALYAQRIIDRSENVVRLRPRAHDCQRERERARRR
jgi:hypothetical protein